MSCSSLGEARIEVDRLYTAVTVCVATRSGLTAPCAWPLLRATAPQPE